MSNPIVGIGVFIVCGILTGCATAESIQPKQPTHVSQNLQVNAVKPMGDFIILDLPHFWAPWVSDALAAADEVVLIAKPDLTHLRNSKSVVEFVGPKRGVDAPTRLVLNHVGISKRGDLTEKDFKDAVAMTPTVSIPFDADLFGRALNNGEMLSKVAAKSKAVAAITALAKTISGREDLMEEKKQSIFSRLKKAK